MECPDDNTLAAFLGGTLAAAARHAFESHVDRCSRCASVVAELGRFAGPRWADSGTLVSIDGAATAITGPSSPTELGAATSPYRGDHPLPGEVVGRYRIEHLVGAGGMGRVFLARDPVLNRRVAVKLLKSDSWRGADARAARERLLREARTVATLSHPNVLPVFDAGEYGEEIFVALEYVDGETLDARLTRTRSSDEIMQLFLAAGEGLAAAHRAGVVHRDFKPQNVLVDRDGRVRVTDFGLARSLEAGAARAITAPGEVVGTPAYMAPEQLFGQPVDARADQFAFCVALYEALYGERPFAAGSLDDLRWQMMNRVPPVPVDRRGLSEAQLAALMRGLKVPPSERFASMDELAAGLRTTVDGGKLHVQVHLIAQSCFALAHLMWTAGIGITACAGAATPPSPPTPGSDGDIDAWAVVAVLGLLVGLAFSFAGAFWAPLNALGLWRRRSWARKSTLAYGVASLFTVLGIPYGLYAIYSLTRPGVRDVLRDRS